MLEKGGRERARVVRSWWTEEDNEGNLNLSSVDDVVVVDDVDDVVVVVDVDVGQNWLHLLKLTSTSTRQIYFRIVPKNSSPWLSRDHKTSTHVTTLAENICY